MLKFQGAPLALFGALWDYQQGLNSTYKWPIGARGRLLILPRARPRLAVGHPGSIPGIEFATSPSVHSIFGWVRVSSKLVYWLVIAGSSPVTDLRLFRACQSYELKGE